ncbi:MAG: hypothetical protein QOE59_1786 [Actinomycetota bacterium]|nr:hypothetical protein [Actinomycetota bacterium]
MVGDPEVPDEPADESARAAAARRRAREALFGDATGASADERDDADRARGDDGGRDRRWYDEQRPPHHG